MIGRVASRGIELPPRFATTADACWHFVEHNLLCRGDDGLEFYVMCEIPSNVILAKAFAERFDGFSN